MVNTQVHRTNNSEMKKENKLGGTGYFQQIKGRLLAAILGSLVVATAEAATDVSGPVIANTVWALAQSPYTVTGDVIVQNGATLTIEPGVVVRFNQDKSLIIEAGSLNARGNTQSHIVFSSLKDDGVLAPAPGDWGHIRLLDGTNDAGTVLEYVRVSYGHGITLQSASPTINHVDITNNAAPAITIDLNCSPAGGNNQATGNILNGIAVPAGDILTNVTWRLGGLPYVVSQGSVSVGQTPMITAISPAEIQQGETVFATISGARLKAAEEVVFAGPGITATLLAGGTETTVPVSVSADPTTPLGSHPFDIKALAGIATFTQGITVVPTQPKLTGVYPTTICTNSATSISLSGINFVPSSVVLLGGAEVPTTFLNSTSITAMIPAQSDAGPKALTIRTPNPDAPETDFYSNTQSLYVTDCSGQGSMCQAPPANLKHWWPAERSANDVMSFKTGVLSNGATFAEGKSGQAFAFDGISSRASLGTDVGNFGTLDFTIQFWVKTASTRGEGLIGKRPICGHSNFWDIRTGSTGRVSVELDQSGTNYLSLSATQPINDNQFHHLAVVRQGPTVSIYVDGALDVSKSTPGTTNLSNTAGLIAGRSTCTGVDGTGAFTGLMDELAIFDRALASTEIEAAFAAGSSSMCKTCTAQSTGIQNWWPGDGNANDLVSTLHGTLVNGTVYAPGKVGEALSLDGINDYVTIGSAAELDLNEFTIEAWIWTDAAGNTGERRVVSRDDVFAEGQDGRELYYIKASSPSVCGGVSNRPAIAIMKGGTFEGICSPSDLPPGFHHLAAVRSGASLSLYIDGVVVATQQSTITGAISPEAPLVLGQVSPAYNGEYFKGLIDEVMIHNRALSAAEMQKRVTADSAGACKPKCAPVPADVVSWWPGDGDANDVIGTNQGSFLAANYANAKVASGFAFDGVDDFVQIPHNANLVPNVGSFTVSAWINTKKSVGSQTVLSKYECGGYCPSGVANSWYALQVVDGKLRAYLRDLYGSDGQSLVAPAFVADGAFHHVSMVRDMMAFEFRVFVDGVLSASAVLTNQSDNAIRDDDGEPDPLLIGAQMTAGQTTKNTHFEGIIDEVQYVNRALSASEMLGIFSAGNQGICKP